MYTLYKTYHDLDCMLKSTLQENGFEMTFSWLNVHMYD